MKWVNFSHQLKTGSVEEADLTIHKILSSKPKNVPAEYLPLWQAAEAWGHLFEKVAPDFLDHYRKARSLEKEGKGSEAIPEYQAALKIIQNLPVVIMIKHIREQSLGL